jgi:hypothetical protein
MLASIGLVAISAEVSRDPRNSQNDFLGKIHSHSRVGERPGPLKTGKKRDSVRFSVKFEPCSGPADLKRFRYSERGGDFTGEGGEAKVSACEILSESSCWIHQENFQKRGVPSAQLSSTPSVTN